jgi:hypothetical protein
MTLYKCKECEAEFKTERSLHAHIKKHKMSTEDYYVKHSPRLDLYSGKPINFKNVKQYLSSQFNSPSNFKKWCTEEERDIVKKYLVEKMKDKVAKKKDLYIMGGVQLSSYGWPDIECIKELFGSFKKFCEEVGKPAQFGGNMPKKFYEDFSSVEIWADTREQKPLNFINPTKKIKLDCGDYTVGGENFDHTFVDRKSPADLIGTLSRDMERFRKEIERCCDIGGYMFIVVDSSMEGVSRELAFSKSKTNIAHVWHNMREILREFGGDCQFVFSGGRAESAWIVPKILMCGKELWKVDVQYFIDKDDKWLGK